MRRDRLETHLNVGVCILAKAGGFALEHFWYPLANWKYGLLLAACFGLTFAPLVTEWLVWQIYPPVVKETNENKKSGDNRS